MSGIQIKTIFPELFPNCKHFCKKSDKCLNANKELQIYEKNDGVGGTWFENTYPGCACDVPSHNYTYSFEPKSDFSGVLASFGEIKDYLETFADKYNLLHQIRTSQQVSKTSWDPQKGQWMVSSTDLRSGETVHDWCHLLVHATGYLNKPMWPKAPGIETFRGPKVHSAQWDDTVSLEGKDVLLVGSGASSAQILPAIQPIVNTVKVFVRTPRWSLPSVSSKHGNFSSEERHRLVNNPEAVLSLRLENERTLNSFFSEYRGLCHIILEKS